MTVRISVYKDDDELRVDPDEAEARDGEEVEWVSHVGEISLEFQPGTGFYNQLHGKHGINPHAYAHGRRGERFPYSVKAGEDELDPIIIID